MSGAEIPGPAPTHDWAAAVDADHLARIRREPAVFAPGGVRHLVLEVMAYAADDGRGGRCVITSTVMARGRSRMTDEGFPMAIPAGASPWSRP